MNTRYLGFLILLISLNSCLQETKSQSKYPLLFNLFEKSDHIVQGKLVSKSCVVRELGVQSCGYRIKVDSVFKGQLDEGDYLKLRPDSSDGPAPISYEISFQHNCLSYLKKGSKQSPPQYFEDYCYEQGQYYIVFLQKQIRINKEESEFKPYFFSLTDQWLSVQPANSYMALVLRQWSKN